MDTCNITLSEALTILMGARVGKGRVELGGLLEETGWSRATLMRKLRALREQAPGTHVELVGDAVIVSQFPHWWRMR